MALKIPYTVFWMIIFLIDYLLVKRTVEFQKEQTTLLRVM